MQVRAPRRGEARRGEAEAVYAVIPAGDVGDLGRANDTQRDVLLDWELAEFDLARERSSSRTTTERSPAGRTPVRRGCVRGALG
jgi:hypothetical protein